MILELKNINKSFGDTKILNNISFKVESGKAFGFLGRNGAGKTTTMRIIMNILSQDSGEVLVDGKPIRHGRIKIGYLPEERGLYNNEKIEHQLIYFSRLKGATRREAKENVRYWLDRFNLIQYRNNNLSTLSKGLKQKVQIIETLLNNPDILILDEPFSGLDPINAEELKVAIGEFIQNKKIVIFSSHIMSYIEEFCQEIAIIETGEIILNGNLNLIKSDMAYGKLLLSAKNLGLWQIKNLLDSNGLIEPSADIKDFKLLVTVKQGFDKDDILNFLILNHVDITSFMLYEPSLQDIFVSKVGIR